MPEITLSQDQVEYLEGLREHIAEEHVGPYGHVRMREAVQFLVDRYEATTEQTADREAVRRAVELGLADRSYQELQRLASDTEGVEPGGKAEELRDRLVEARVATVLEEDRSAADEQRTEDDGTDEVADEAAEAASAAEGREESADNGDEAPESDASGDDSGGDNSDSDDGSSRLQRMMGLLDRHDDVWDETDSEEGKYSVTLPDGSTETVRTKDDVRALLFKHYD